MRFLLLCLAGLLLQPDSLVAQRLIYSKDIPVEKIRIVPETALGGTINERISDLEYIPLKANKNQLLDQAYTCILSNNRIGILSGKGHLYLYNIQGDLIKIFDQIPGVKKIREDNLFFNHITTTEKGFRLTQGMRYVNVDWDGNLIDTITIKEDTTSHYTTTIGNSSWHYSVPQFHNKKIMETKTLSQGDRTIVTYQKMDSIFQPYNSYSSLSEIQKNNKAYAKFTYSTHLFELDSSGVSKVYQFIFPLKNTLNLEEVIKLKDFMPVIQYMNAHQSVITGIGDVFPYRDYLMVQLQLKGNFTIAINMKTKEIIGLRNIIPNKDNDYLAFMNRNILSTDGEYLYSILFPEDIRQAIGKSIDERHPVSDHLKALEKVNNPIFVRFKLK
ncbi:hypothetical protein MUK51_10660 [Sphingobacterium faecium]|jgi:hypothetical protein|uniref:hypothetical protein n=1 Tax=Sphingobacterium faecium TaxID=34087 RepID=UPI0004E5FA83|nr:hypothetical protein [Sphingobacterium faecium]UXD71732.1 hypothetical protein MUK51_10660 [Sphingobacterium faecium]CDS92623.1 exported hypothetical protein [Sphingobacterium sp. PM2-P1-29]SJN52384.1 hypothetical protein FM120_35440 [Sphingobacterium faecium PCAi_F2.5]